LGKRLFSTSGAAKHDKSVSKAFNNLPWNFNAHLRRMRVQNLQTPLDLQACFLANEEATCLFKDYADAIFCNDLDSIAD